MKNGIMKPKFILYLRFFCAAAIAASMVLDYFGYNTGVNALGSAGFGVTATYAASKFALIV